jgi:hypothetical protein
MASISNGFYNLKGGQYDKFCTTKYADGKIKCNVDVATDTEKFQIINVGNGKFNIKNSNGKFCSDSTDFILCNKDSGTGNSEQFIINDMIGSYDIIGGNQNLYCADASYYKCNRDSSGPWTYTKILPISTTTNVNTTPGNTTPGNTTSRNTNAGNTTPGNTNAGNTTSRNTTPGNTTSRNTNAGNTTSRNTTPGTKRTNIISAPSTCSTYDVRDPATLYDTLNDTDPSMYGFMLDCLQKKINDKNRPLQQLITSHEVNKKDAITASEMNRGMRDIYQSDLFFTISKIFMFIILICVYVYFFKYTGIIQPIKDGAIIVKDNLDKVKDIKMPKLKMPEVTMPSIKMPK